MADAQDGFPTHEEITERIIIKIHKLARGRRINPQDREDMIQRLWLEILKQMPRLDLFRANVWTYLDRILESKGATIMEERRTQKHNRLVRAASLDAPVGLDDGEETTLGELYSQDEYFETTGLGPRPEFESVDTRLDVQEALERLSAKERWLAEQLMWKFPADIEAEFDIPHTTLHDRIVRLALKLAANGLADYAATFLQKKRRNRRRISGPSGMCRLESNDSREES